MSLRVSIITTCKQRRAYLARALPSFLGQARSRLFEFDVIVVDYNCPQKTFNWLRSLSDPRLKAVRLAVGKSDWSWSHARNVGACLTDADILAFIDADVVLPESFLSTAMCDFLLGGFDRMHPVFNGAAGYYAHGQCLARSEGFHAVRGYDESLTDYGYEDIDFFLRSDHRGHLPGFWNASCDVIKHDDQERTRFCSETNMQLSIEKNVRSCADPSRIVNRRGYGIGRVAETLRLEPPNPWQLLRRRYPWPAIPSALPCEHGWFGDGNRRLLNQVLSSKTQFIVELGSWFGLSARFLLEQAPAARVMAVDLWQADPGHMVPPEIRAVAPQSYDIFLANLWQYRERLTPVRNDTVCALHEIAGLGLHPDVIYVDADHSFVDVVADVTTALDLFPKAIVLGDDWSWDTVRQAVQTVAKQRQLRIEVDENAWILRTDPRH